MKTILLTGASGFTGLHFIKLAMELGYKIVALSHSQLKIDGVESIQCDLRNRAELITIIDQIKFDYVVHLAAISFVAHEDVSEIYAANVLGTINLMDAIEHSPNCVEKILVASSGNIYGNAQSLPIEELHQYSPENDYAASKCAMELALQHRKNRLPIVIVRPFNYTGAGQAAHFLVPKLVNAFKKRQEVIELGNLDVARDFSDVRDLVSVYLRLLDAPNASGVYNFCRGESVSLNQIIENLTTKTNHKPKVIVNPRFVRENEVKELFGCPDKLLAEIGEFRNFSFSDTLDWMLQS